jgi:hypothetical protein
MAGAANRHSQLGRNAGANAGGIRWVEVPFGLQIDAGKILLLYSIFMTQPMRVLSTHHAQENQAGSIDKTNRTSIVNRHARE